MSFRLKTILGVALIEGILLAILIGSVFNQMYAFSRNQYEDYARVTLTNFANTTQDGVLSMDLARLQSFVDAMGRNPDIVYARIVYRDGHVLAETGKLPDPASPLQLDKDIDAANDGVYDVRQDIVAGGKTHGRVELGIGLERLHSTYAQVRLKSWLIAGGEMGLVALFSYLLGTYLTRQIKGLQDAAKRLSQGELGYQVTVRGSDELAEAASAFNAMSRQLLQDQKTEAEFTDLLHAREVGERQRLEALVEARTAALVDVGREFRMLVENMPANIVRYDRDCRVVYISPQFELSTGIPGDKMLGTRPLDRGAKHGKADFAAYQRLIEDVLATGTPAETDLTLDTPRGERLHQVRMVAERDADGNIIGVLAVGMDNTERQQGEARLSLLSFAMDQVSEAVLLFDEQGRILYANHGVSVMYGYAPEEWNKLSVGDLRHAFDPEQWRHFWQRLRDQGSMVYESVNYAKDGREFKIEVNANYFETNGIGYNLSLGRDISERKQLEAAREAALQEAERLARTRSAFLANMSHEIRTPLNAVLGIAQLGMRNSRTGKVQSQFAAILDAGQLLLGLVNDILDFSKIDAGKLTLEQGWVNPGELIDRVVELTAARAYAKGLEYRVRESPELPPGGFPGDPLRLAQVLVNLLSNAIKFTEQGGVLLQIERAQENLIFTVSDTGIGMTEEQIANLFIPFEQADASTTRRFGGTGLGLAISKNLIDLMGGELQVRGRPEHGMVFKVKLPVSGMGPGNPPAAVGRIWLIGPGCALELAEELGEWGIEPCIGSVMQAVAGAPGPLIMPYSMLTQRTTLAHTRQALELGRRLAVITPPGGIHAVPADLIDRVELLAWPPRSRHLLHLMTGAPPVQAQEAHAAEPRKRLAGIRILSAEDNDMNRMILEELLTLEGAKVESVENGRLLVDRLSRGRKDFDVVMTDVQMPEMDGYEATRQIRKLLPNLPIIGLTAHVLGEERDRCLECGMSAHLGKPANLDALVQLILELHAPMLQEKPLKEAGPSIAVLAQPASEVSVPTDAESIVDWAVLEANFLGKQDLVRRACALLIDKHGDTPARLRALAASGNTSDLALLAHNLKGMAGNLQANSVRDQAVRVWQQLKEGRAEMGAAEALACEMERLLTEVASHLRPS